MSAGAEGVGAPTPRLDLEFLWNEVQLAGDIVLTIAPSNVWAGLTCTEAEAIAGIFSAAGRQDVHDFIINEHGLGDDDPEDEHRNIYEEAHNDQS